MNNDEYKKVPDLTSRWLITGTIETMAELHIGDGEAASVHDRQRPAEGEESDASTVCIAHNKAAYIPASTWKGPLRALVFDEWGNIKPEWRELFGSDKPDLPDSCGGMLEFWDAFHIGGEGKESETYKVNPANKSQLESDRKRPWWDYTRKTCVAVSVSLDRRTRTAKENLLYHLEYVPKGERFHFEITGDNLKMEHVGRLLVLLDALDQGKTTLGAQSSNGWGRVSCKVEKVLCIDESKLKDWKEQPVAGVAAFEKFGEDKQPAAEEAAKGVDLNSSNNELQIKIELQIESPWLVRDPRQRERSKTAKEKLGLLEAEKPPDAVAVHSEEGDPFLPPKSLRGALRSQAEKILRTVGLPCPDHPGDKSNSVTTKGKSPRQAIDEVKNKDLASKLFGLSGWLAPLHIPRFRIKSGESSQPHHQEFVAIDRFTGGAAEGAKFDADLAGATRLTGTLTIDRSRLKMIDAAEKSLGLLALLLRDLAEGDIPIGSGSAKGQGFCTATIQWNGEDLFDPDCEAGNLVTAFQKSIPNENPTPPESP